MYKSSQPINIKQSRISFELEYTTPSECHTHIYMHPEELFMLVHCIDRILSCSYQTPLGSELEFVTSSESQSHETLMLFVPKYAKFVSKNIPNSIVCLQKDAK